jgi:DNA-binding CsgD family transcriptional regulator
MTHAAGSADSAGGQVEPLSIREVEVLRLLALGLEIGEIAADLNLSSHTVLNHVRNARRKLRARNRLGAVLTALRLGLI